MEHGNNKRLFIVNGREKKMKNRNDFLSLDIEAFVFFYRKCEYSDSQFLLTITFDFSLSFSLPFTTKKSRNAFTPKCNTL